MNVAARGFGERLKFAHDSPLLARAFIPASVSRALFQSLLGLMQRLARHLLPNSVRAQLPISHAPTPQLESPLYFHSALGIRIVRKFKRVVIVDGRIKEANVTTPVDSK